MNTDNTLAQNARTQNGTNLNHKYILKYIISTITAVNPKVGQI